MEWKILHGGVDKKAAFTLPSFPPFLAQSSSRPVGPTDLESLLVAKEQALEKLQQKLNRKAAISKNVSREFQVYSFP